MAEFTQEIMNPNYSPQVEALAQLIRESMRLAESEVSHFGTWQLADYLAAKIIQEYEVTNR